MNHIHITEPEGFRSNLRFNMVKLSGLQSHVENGVFRRIYHPVHILVVTLVWVQLHQALKSESGRP
jgi:hypothetical protein